MTNEITRRNFIKLATVLGVSSAVCPLSSLMLPESAMAATFGPLKLYNAHTNEGYAIQLFQNGKFTDLGLIACDYLMRDFRRNEIVQCDRKLYAMLFTIQFFYKPEAPIIINSGYRSKQTNAMLRARSIERAGKVTWETPAVNSKHTLAKAVDFVVPGVPPREIAKFVQERRWGGTGNYSNFTHMDTGPVRRWGPNP